MATFGNTTKQDDATNFSEQPFGSKFVLAESGSVSSISVYLKQFSSITPNIKCAIYSDESNYPKTLLGTTEQWTLTTAFDDWHIFNFATPISLMAGTYWLVVWTSDWATLYEINTGGNTVGFTTESYGSFADSFWAGITVYNWILSIYATYSAAPSTFNLKVNSTPITGISFTIT